MQTTLKLKTAPAARSLNLPVFTLLNWIRYGLVAAPERDSSGHYLWGAADLEAAREVQRHRPAPRSLRNAA